MFKTTIYNLRYKFLYCFIYTSFIIILYNILNKQWSLIISYIDSFFIAGFSLICVGFLIIISYYGIFDIFGYTFSRKKENAKNLYEYSTIKKEKRTKKKYNFLPYFIVGFLDIILSVILYAFL